MSETHRNHPFRRRHWAIAVCFWAVGAFAQPSPKGEGKPEAKGVVIDRAVASIEGQVLTLSQLEFEARVLLVNAGAVAAAFAPLDHEALSAGLTAIIDERLATLEADKLDAYPVPQEEVEKAIAEFRARFESEARFRDFLARNEAELSDVGRVLERSLRARRALEGKLRLRVQISDEDVAAAKAATPALRDVADALVKQRLANERFQQLVKQELAAARRDVDVRLLGPFSQKAAAP
ncbi:MAG: hypothetical protein AB1730_02185 [Myxococcota bacterium]|jgi:hypothetical protein